MQLFGIADVLDSIPGVTSVTDYIKGKAKDGAEQAIPDIQNQVKATVIPYLAIAFILGLGGLAFGVKAYRRTMAKPTSGALSGARRRRR